MSHLRAVVCVHVFIALLVCNGLSVSQGQGDDSVGVKSKLGFVQKVMAKFFGCEPITTTSATVTCTVKSKEVDCNSKLPVGTKATFRCDYEFYLTKSYNTTECKRGKKWDPQPPKCLPSSDPEAAAAIAFAETSTVVTQSTAATIKTTTIKFVKKNHVNPFPTEPLLLPISVKTYEGVGTLSVPAMPPALVGQPINVTIAKKVCKYNNAKLMSVDSVLARDALESMMILSHTKKGVWLDSTFDATTKNYYVSPGVLLNPGLWCETEPTGESTDNSIYFGYFASTPMLTYCVIDGKSGNDLSVVCRE